MSAIRRWLHERPRWIWPVAGLVVVALVAATAIALTGDGGDDTVAIGDDPPATSTTSAPTTTTTTITTTTAPPTTAAPTTTRPPAVTTTRPPATVPSGPVPGAVTVTYSGSGGGSGEIMVQWDPVAGATGYRILRSSSAGGAFAVVADFDATTGHVTTVEDGITVWAASDIPLVQYIEYGELRTRWFQVVAYNANGDGPPSATVSGSSPS
jgi:hypothetical protein